VVCTLIFVSYFWFEIFLVDKTFLFCCCYCRVGMSILGIPFLFYCNGLRLWLLII